MYDADVHFYMTYYLASEVGLTTATMYARTIDNPKGSGCAGAKPEESRE